MVAGTNPLSAVPTMRREIQAGDAYDRERHPVDFDRLPDDARIAANRVRHASWVSTMMDRRPLLAFGRQKQSPCSGCTPRR